jgi:hypothetical protein
MDMLLGGLAFAAIILGQFAAVIAVHRERKNSESATFAPPPRDHRAIQREISARLCEPPHATALEQVPSIGSTE